VLSDKAKRAAYDTLYFDLQDQWTSYREWQETQRKDEERKRADEEQRAARERAERERKAAEAERARRMEEEKRAAREKAERERMREERERKERGKLKSVLRKSAGTTRAGGEREATQRERKGSREEVRRSSKEGQDRAGKSGAGATEVHFDRGAAGRHSSQLYKDAGSSRTSRRRACAACAAFKIFYVCSSAIRLAEEEGQGKLRILRSFRCPECNVSACASCKYKYCVY
jgi:hypothetical protein